MHLLPSVLFALFFHLVTAQETIWYNPMNDTLPSWSGTISYTVSTTQCPGGKAYCYHLASVGYIEHTAATNNPPYQRIFLSYSLAAASLRSNGKDKCSIQYSVDNGASWNITNETTADTDVSNTYSFTNPSADNVTALKIRLERTGGVNHGCYYNEFTLSGTRITSSPTNQPTAAPTKPPTNLPTSSPTKTPTNQPTIHPTKNPTIPPTENPTTAPTKVTIPPTENPTISPTKNPTNLPTSSPTENPTIPPTTGPTYHPTTAPTNVTIPPTTGAPTSPTGAPTAQPTDSWYWSEWANAGDYVSGESGWWSQNEVNWARGDTDYMTGMCWWNNYGTFGGEWSDGYKGNTYGPYWGKQELYPGCYRVDAGQCYKSMRFHFSYLEIALPVEKERFAHLEYTQMFQTDGTRKGPGVSATWHKQVNAEKDADCIIGIQIMEGSIGSRCVACRVTKIRVKFGRDLMTPPSSSPSAAPTVPSSNPTPFTLSPSGAPTAVTPTAVTSAPSDATVAPSGYPSQMPSVAPSEQPSVTPSSKPTAPPTTASPTLPTFAPTPTEIPTYNPIPSGYWSSWVSATYSSSRSLSTYDDSHITEFCVRSGDLMDAIKVGWRNGAWSEWVGGTGGSETCYALSSIDDCFDAIRVWKGDSMDALQFRKSDGSITTKCGGSGGSMYWITRQNAGECIKALTVRYIGSSSGILKGIQAYFEQFTPFITPSPTLRPSVSPTAPPTIASPTLTPSVRPTNVPSAPTMGPTAMPSNYPTNLPSASPTEPPSHTTVPPTDYPSVSPTLYPSVSPSDDPTASPSSPSEYPSKYPTGNPAKYSSESPTKYPSKFPSKYPTDNPSNMPSNEVITPIITASQLEFTISITLTTCDENCAITEDKINDILIAHLDPGVAILRTEIVANTVAVSIVADASIDLDKDVIAAGLESEYGEAEVVIEGNENGQGDDEDSQDDPKIDKNNRLRYVLSFLCGLIATTVLICLILCRCWYLKKKKSSQKQANMIAMQSKADGARNGGSAAAEIRSDNVVDEERQESDDNDSLYEHVDDKPITTTGGANYVDDEKRPKKQENDHDNEGMYGPGDVNNEPLKWVKTTTGGKKTTGGKAATGEGEKNVNGNKEPLTIEGEDIATV